MRALLSQNYKVSPNKFKNSGPPSYNIPHVKYNRNFNPTHDSHLNFVINFMIRVAKKAINIIAKSNPKNQ